MINIICDHDPLLDRPDCLIVKKIANTVLLSENVKKGEVSFIFASDELLAELKKKYFNQNHYTDVISFRLDDNKKNNIDGEIYISLQRAKENADLYNQPYEKEIARLIIHGCLHLIGFNDNSPNEKTIMTNMEDKFLNTINWENIFSHK
tara:strand:+ start:1725 stop:2171 length:447 start_codon:yes stop_codon:yes gene_type:complete